VVSSALARALLSLAVLGAFPTASQTVAADERRTLSIRGHEQILHLYGPPAGEPVIVSSGDGGWVHLAPYVAERLAAKGCFVVGFDVKSYLKSFTSETQTLRAEDEPGDYRVLAELASRTTGKKPVLIGISEGAGLSVLAATDPGTKSSIAGVIGLGLPDLNELGWRWKDWVIYLTHKEPDEPLFSAAAIAGGVAPMPLAAIHSTGDEFVPVAEIQRVLENAREPKKLWIVKASNHRFSDNLAEFEERLTEALQWVREKTPR
jgi:alpha-beta hydrolase superfamily lysophospholipase